jgi:hypothetical protein
MSCIAYCVSAQNNTRNLGCHSSLAEVLQILSTWREVNCEDLPCFFSNQPDALIIQNYYVINLYMFRASSLTIIRSFHCTFGTGKFHAGLDDRFEAESG